MYIGKIIGENINELHFRIPHNKNIYIGEILIAVDAYNGLDYLLRVIDIRYGYESGERNWAQKTAGNIMMLEEHGYSGEMTDKEKRLFKVGVAVPLGYIKNAEQHTPYDEQYRTPRPTTSDQQPAMFRRAKTLPPHFANVRRSTPADFKFLNEEYKSDLEIGFLRSGETIIEQRTGLKGSDIAMHIGIFATTGMGKSNLMKCLATSFLTCGKYGLLLFDAHSEYFGQPKILGLKDHPFAKDNLRYYTNRKTPYPHREIRFSIHEISPGDLKNVYEFTPPQLELLERLDATHPKDWVKLINEKDSTAIQSVLGGWFHEGTIQVLKRRINSLLRGGIFVDDETYTISRDIVKALHDGKVVLIDTSMLNSIDELLVTTILARTIFEKNKKLYEERGSMEDIPTVLITLEEAQRVLSRMTGNIYSAIAREGRKFKVGLCAIAQQPRLIGPEILSQFNTLLILRLADKNDRENIIRASSHDISQLDNEIQTLMPGEAILSSISTPFPLPMKIHKFEDYISYVRDTQYETRDTKHENINKEEPLDDFF